MASLLPLLQYTKYPLPYLSSPTFYDAGVTGPPKPINTEISSSVNLFLFNTAKISGSVNLFLFNTVVSANDTMAKSKLKPKMNLSF